MFKMPRSLCHRIVKEQCRRTIDSESRVSSADPIVGFSVISRLICWSGWRPQLRQPCGTNLIGVWRDRQATGRSFFLFSSPSQNPASNAKCSNQMRDSSGDDRDRTGNLRLAKPALSQLSYVPKRKSEARMSKSAKPGSDIRASDLSAIGRTWTRTTDLSFIRAAL